MTSRQVSDAVLSDLLTNPKCYWGAPLPSTAATRREFLRATISRISPEWVNKKMGLVFSLSVSPILNNLNACSHLALDVHDAYRHLPETRKHLLDAKLKALLAQRDRHLLETIRFEFALFGLLGYSQTPWDIEPLAGETLSNLAPSPDAVIHVPGMAPCYLECTTIGCSVYEERDRVDKALGNMVQRECEKCGKPDRKLAIDIEHRGRTHLHSINTPEVRVAVRQIARTDSGEVTLRLIECWIRLAWRQLVRDRRESTPLVNVWRDGEMRAEMPKAVIGPKTFVLLSRRVNGASHLARMAREVERALSRTLHVKRRQLRDAGVLADSVLLIRPRAAWISPSAFEGALDRAAAAGQFGELPAVGFVDNLPSTGTPQERLRFSIRTERPEHNAVRAFVTVLERVSTLAHEPENAAGAQ